MLNAWIVKYPETVKEIWIFVQSNWSNSNSLTNTTGKKIVLEFRIESKRRTEFRGFQACVQSSKFIKRRGYAIKMVVFKMTDDIYSRGQASEAQQNK